MRHLRRTPQFSSQVAHEDGTREKCQQEKCKLNRSVTDAETHTRPCAKLKSARQGQRRCYCIEMFIAAWRLYAPGQIGNVQSIGNQIELNKQIYNNGVPCLICNNTFYKCVLLYT